MLGIQIDSLCHISSLSPTEDSKCFPQNLLLIGPIGALMAPDKKPAYRTSPQPFLGHMWASGITWPLIRVTMLPTIIGHRVDRRWDPKHASLISTGPMRWKPGLLPFQNHRPKGSIWYQLTLPNLMTEGQLFSLHPEGK